MFGANISPHCVWVCVMCAQKNLEATKVYFVDEVQTYSFFKFFPSFIFFREKERMEAWQVGEGEWLLKAHRLDQSNAAIYHKFVQTTPPPHKSIFMYIVS